MEDGAEELRFCLVDSFPVGNPALIEDIKAKIVISPVRQPEMKTSN